MPERAQPEQRSGGDAAPLAVDLAIVALLRSGAAGTPSLLSIDRAPSDWPTSDGTEVRLLPQTELAEALDDATPDLGREKVCDYVAVTGATLARAADGEAFLAALERLARCGTIVAPPHPDGLDRLGESAGKQTVHLEWSEDSPLVLRLHQDRPDDGLDGSLRARPVEEVRRVLAEARARSLSVERDEAMRALLRESAERRRIEAELTRVRSLPLARRLYRNAAFSNAYSWVLRRRGAEQGRSEPVFFLVGRGKSGTSWLMRALDEHPSVLCKGEGRFFGETADARRLDRRSLLSTLQSSTALRGWTDVSAWTRGASFTEEMEQLAGAGVERLLRRTAAAAGKPIVGDKTPMYAGGVIAQIARACPDARVIHIIRDGRDVAVSALHHVWNQAEPKGRRRRDATEMLAKRDSYRAGELSAASGQSAFTPDFLAGLARSWATITAEAIADGKLLGERYLEVRYERMLEDPSAELARAFRFIGADPDPETIDRCVERSSFERLSEGRRRGSEDSSSFYRKGVAGDWRRAFTAEDRELFKSVAGDLLVELGYEDDSSW